MVGVFLPGSKTTFSSFELEIHSTVSSVSIPKDFIFPESLKVPVSANLSFSFQSQRKKTPTMCHTASAPPPFINSTNVGMFRQFDIFFTILRFSYSIQYCY